jgi:hypothetical protein
VTKIRVEKGMACAGYKAMEIGGSKEPEPSWPCRTDLLHHKVLDSLELRFSKELMGGSGE